MPASQIVPPSHAYHVEAGPQAGRAVILCAEQGLLLDVERGTVVAQFIHDGKPDLLNVFPRARFSPDGSRFATYLAWNTAFVWDSQKAAQVAGPFSSERFLEDVIFTRDDAQVLTSSGDGFVRVWRDGDSSPLSEISHPRRVTTIRLSQDESRLLTACGDGFVRLWDLQSARMTCPPMQLGGEVYAAEFILDDRAVVAYSSRNVARVWEVASGKPLSPELPVPPTMLMKVSGSGRQVLFDLSNRGQVLDLPVKSHDLTGLFVLLFSPR